MSLVEVGGFVRQVLTTAGDLAVQSASGPVRLPYHRLHAKTPMLPQYGAKGDYNPDTDAGTDDTAAIQAWLSDLGPNELGYLPPNRLFLITSPLATPANVHIEGGGKSSGLFFKLSDPSKHGLNLGGIDATTQARPVLRNFVVGGRTTPGAGAIRAYSISYGDLNLWMGGGWTYLLYVANTVSFGDISHGGGIECSHIRLIHENNRPLAGYSYALPNALHGVYNVGWSNAVVYDLDLQSNSGYGVYLKGNYSAANGGTRISGSFQGVGSASPLYEAIHVEQGNAFSLERCYCEANGAPIPIVLTNVNGGAVRDSMGPLRLSTCSNMVVSNVGNVVTVDSDCVGTVIEGGGADNPPLINASPSTVTRGRRSYNTVTSSRFPVANAETSPANVALNGDFERWLAGATTNNVWGCRPASSNFYYKATQCGDGLTDTTRTTYARFCALVEKRPSFGNVMAWQLWQAGELSGLVGQAIWVSVKYKVAQGAVYFQGSDSATGSANQIDPTAAATTWSVENGFTQFAYGFAISAAMVTNGFDFRVLTPDASGPVATKVYIAELMAGIGAAPPPMFQRATCSPRQPQISLVNGRLIVPQAAAPVSGGDPLFSSDWQVGDEVIFTAPASGGNRGAVCVTAGSPGTWKSWGVIS